MILPRMLRRVCRMFSDGWNGGSEWEWEEEEEEEEDV